jgi:hypothetical protein
VQADDEGAEGEARRKTKKEVMEEIIAKSKMHKMLRKRCVNIMVLRQSYFASIILLST